MLLHVVMLKDFQLTSTTMCKHVYTADVTTCPLVLPKLEYEENNSSVLLCLLLDVE